MKVLHFETGTGNHRDQYGVICTGLAQARKYFKNHSVYRNWGFRYIGPDTASALEHENGHWIGIDVAKEVEESRLACIANGGDMAIWKLYN